MGKGIKNDLYGTNNRPAAAPIAADKMVRTYPGELGRGPRNVVIGLTDSVGPELVLLLVPLGKAEGAEGRGLLRPAGVVLAAVDAAVHHVSAVLLLLLKMKKSSVIHDHSFSLIIV